MTEELGRPSIESLVDRLEKSALSPTEGWANGEWKVDHELHYLVYKWDHHIFLDLTRVAELFFDYAATSGWEPAEWYMQSLYQCQHYDTLFNRYKWAYGEWFFNFEENTMSLLAKVRGAKTAIIVVDDMYKVMDDMDSPVSRMFYESNDEDATYRAEIVMPNGAGNFTDCTVTILRLDSKGSPYYSQVAEKTFDDCSAAKAYIGEFITE